MCRREGYVDKGPVYANPQLGLCLLMLVGFLWKKPPLGIPVCPLVYVVRCKETCINHTCILSHCLAAAGLRTPLAVPGPYPAPFGMVPHAGMNGELTSPGAAYASLHNMSPQMSAAAAAAAVVAYGRSPMVGLQSG